MAIASTQGQVALSEAALAEVTEGMALLNRAERHLDLMEARLRHCRVNIDSDSFRNVRYYLDQIYEKLAPIPLQQAEALAAKK